MNRVNNQKYYQTLGIDKNATEIDIKNAYTRLAEMFRPDKIKEKKGREALYIEKQTWNEILDAYSEALKGIDNKKRRNKESEKGNNSANNQENFVQESEESENNNKQELTVEEKKKIWDELNDKNYWEIHKRDHDDNGNWTRESDIRYLFLAKRGKLSDPISVLGKTWEQFYEELAFYTLECSLCGGCKSWLCGIYGHVVHCLKTRQEIEELHQKKVKLDIEWFDNKILQLALADEESVREVDKIRKNRGCIRCYQEQNRSIPDNNQLTLTSNEKRDSSEQSLTISDQESQRGEINNNTNNQRNEQLENNFNLTISEQKPQANELLKIVISGELLIKKKQFNREILTKLITEKKNNPSLLSTLK